MSKVLFTLMMAWLLVAVVGSQGCINSDDNQCEHNYYCHINVCRKCINCSDYKRETLQVSKSCIRNVFDCGKCMDDFVKDNDGDISYACVPPASASAPPTLPPPSLPPWAIALITVVALILLAILILLIYFFNPIKSITSKTDIQVTGITPSAPSALHLSAYNTHTASAANGHAQAAADVYVEEGNVMSANTTGAGEDAGAGAGVGGAYVPSAFNSDPPPAYTVLPPPQGTEIPSDEQRRLLPRKRASPPRVRRDRQWARYHRARPFCDARQEEGQPPPSPQPTSYPSYHDDTTQPSYWTPLSDHNDNLTHDVGDSNVDSPGGGGASGTTPSLSLSQQLGVARHSTLLRPPTYPTDSNNNGDTSENRLMPSVSSSGEDTAHAATLPGSPQPDTSDTHGAHTRYSTHGTNTPHAHRVPPAPAVNITVNQFNNFTQMSDVS